MEAAKSGKHFADDIFNQISWMKKIGLCFKFTNFVTKYQVDNKSALVQVLAWSWVCHKPSPELMIAQFTQCIHASPGIIELNHKNYTPDIVLNLHFNHCYVGMSLVQSSAIIMCSNIRYCINDCRNSGRISIRCWIHKRHRIPRPNYGVSFVNIFEKIDHVITALHCITKIWEFLSREWHI